MIPKDTISMPSSISISSMGVSSLLFDYLYIVAPNIPPVKGFVNKS